MEEVKSLDLPAECSGFSVNWGRSGSYCQCTGSDTLSHGEFLVVMVCTSRGTEDGTVIT